jgi:glutamine---fructose-6-phosphate transaminase (isomerizing)
MDSQLKNVSDTLPVEKNQMADVRTSHPYFLYDAIQAQPDLIEQVFGKQRAAIEAAAAASAGKKRFVFIGIGTSLNAANVCERWMRFHSGGRVLSRGEQSFEFALYPLALGPEDVAIVITHTGTTSKSIDALRTARESGAMTIAVTGQKPGDGVRGADYHIETCEQEVAFAYTKSYTTALAALAKYIIAVLGERNLLKDSAGADAALEKVPSLMRQALRSELKIREIAKQIANRDRIVFFGAGTCWATANEAALKIKESTYIAAEGFETEEILHGPFSEIDSRDVMVGMLTGDAGDERARTILRAGGELGMPRIAITVPEANRDIAAEHVIVLPETPVWLAPFIHLIPLQLLTYHIALARGINPDSGRQDQEAHARAHKVYKL